MFLTKWQKIILSSFNGCESDVNVRYVTVVLAFYTAKVGILRLFHLQDGMTRKYDRWVHRKEEEVTVHVVLLLLPLSVHVLVTQHVMRTSLTLKWARSRWRLWGWSRKVEHESTRSTIACQRTSAVHMNHNSSIREHERIQENIKKKEGAEVLQQSKT